MPRWYDPAVAHFTQADTIVPNAGDSAAYDRYAYVKNNPVKYTDPSGHKYLDGEYMNDSSPYSTSIEHTAKQYKITFGGNWTLWNKTIAIEAVEDIAKKMAEGSKTSPKKVFKNVYQYLNLTWGSSNIGSGCLGVALGACTSSPHQINFFTLAKETISGGGVKSNYLAYIEARNNIVHEFGHAFGQKWYRHDYSYDPKGPYSSRVMKYYLTQNEEGFATSPAEAYLTWRQHPASMKDGLGLTNSEIFADMFLGWTYSMWENSSMGMIRSDFMTTHMAEWLTGF